MQSSIMKKFCAGIASNEFNMMNSNKELLNVHEIIIYDFVGRYLLMQEFWSS